MLKKLFCLAIATLACMPGSRAAADAQDDVARAQRIAQELKESGELRDYRVGVKYQDGVAWLMGTVTSPEQKRTAERLAGQCAGVDRVISKLSVASANTAQTSSEDQGVELAGGVDADEYQQPAMPQAQPMPAMARRAGGNMPVPYARMGGPAGQGGPGGPGGVQPAGYGPAGCPPGMGGPGMGGPGMGAGGYQPAGYAPTGMGQAVSYDNPQMPGYAWPSYAAYPNYAALTYPQQYSPAAWPYIGPFYPYPQVPLGWRKVTLEWDDGWWFLDFKDQH